MCLRKQEKINFIRYPGGKGRLLNYIIPYLPSRETITGKFIEPFLGSGAVFFILNPKYSLLADINPELIDLYRGVRRYPFKVWEIYKSFPNTKEAYYKIRAIKPDGLSLAFRAARTLYLNRTCFRGIWRYNSKGEFNVSYEGRDNRWVINEQILIKISNRLKHAILKCSDFEEIIDGSTAADFIFVDPPYRPGERELLNDLYVSRKFSYSDYQRLAEALKRASKRNVKWTMIISSHPDIIKLFSDYHIVPIPKGTGRDLGILVNNPGEVIIHN